MSLKQSGTESAFEKATDSSILRRFTNAWTEHGDAAIEAFVPPTGSPDRYAILRDLIKIDIEQRWKRDKPAHVEDYLRQFPELGESAEAIPDLVAEEIEVRQLLGHPPSEAELRQRFPSLSDSRLSALVTLKQGPPNTNGEGRRKLSLLSASRMPERIGRYEIHGLIGKGGFATVYRAWDPELRRPVAIKVPHTGLFHDPEIHARLLREASSAARLRNPAIVSLYEVGECETGGPYLAYEFIPGPTLATLIKETRPGPELAARWVARLARALEYAHQCGIVHRDVKPGNVIMDRDGQPMLADFGLALQVDASVKLTQHGDILGTPAYMSPEQAVGHSEKIDARTDVYSLGALLYELLCGRPPFEGNAASVLQQVLHEEPTSLRRSMRAIAPDLETICLKAMAKEPERRYRTAGELAEDLERFLQHRPILARRTGPVGRLVRWCRRKPALATTLFVSAALVVLTAALAFWRVAQERDQFRTERDRAQFLAAKLALDQATHLCDQGDIPLGLPWMVRAVQLAPADATELDWAVRMNLAAWENRIGKLQGFLPHEAQTHRVALSRDGRIALTADVNWKAHLWSVEAKRLLASYPTTSQVCSVAFHPTRDLAMIAEHDGAVHLWDLETKQTADKIVSPSPIHCAALSPDGESIVLGSEDQTCRFFAIATRKVRSIAIGAHPSALAFTPDGKTLVVGCKEGGIYIVDIERETKRAAAGTSGSAVVALAMFPDGKSFVAATDDQSAQVWTVANGQPSGPPLRHNNRVHGVLVSPDGRRILTGCLDRAVRSWHAKTGRLEGVLLRHAGPIDSIAQSADGATLITAGTVFDAQVWTMPRSPAAQAEIPLSRPLWTLAASPTSNTVIAGMGDGKHGEAQLFDITKRAPAGPLLPHFGLVKAVAFHPTGQSFVTGCYGSHVQRWSTENCKPLDARIDIPNVTVAAVALSPDGRAMLIADMRNPHASVWDSLDAKNLRFRVTHEQPVRAGVFSKDGRWILTGGYDKTARLWNSNTGANIGEPWPHAGAVGAVAISDDGKLAATGNDFGTAQVWELPAGKPVGPTLQHHGTVRAVDFSRDGRLLLTGSWDRTARLWSSTLGIAIGPPMVHEGEVEGAVFLADGETIVTGGLDKKLRIWPVPRSMQGSAEELARWVQVTTGLELDRNQNFQILDAATWSARKAGN